MSTFHHPQNSRVLKVEQAIHGLRTHFGASDRPSYLADDYRVGTYKYFGQSRYSYELARDLLSFRDELALEADTSMRFWAVFEQSDDLSAAEFEKCLLREVTSAVSHPEFAGTEAPEVGSAANEDDETNPLFFKLDGTVFSVMGVHPHTASESSRFPQPTLIFAVHFNHSGIEISDMPKALADTAASELNLDSSWPELQLSGRENQVDWKFPVL